MLMKQKVHRISFGGDVPVVGGGNASNDVDGGEWYGLDLGQDGCDAHEVLCN